MTWAKVDDRFNDEPKLLALPRGVRLLHIEGIVWCCRHLTDGSIPSHVLGKVTDEPDPVAAASQLVEAGLWRATDAGWDVVDFGKDQTSKADVERVKTLADARRRKHSLHSSGVHDLCDPKYCNARRVADASETASPTAPSPTRTSPTLREERSGRGAAGAAAPSGSRRATAPGVPSRPRTPLVVEVVKP